MSGGQNGWRIMAQELLLVSRVRFKGHVPLESGLQTTSSGVVPVGQLLALTGINTQVSPFGKYPGGQGCPGSG